MPTRGTRNWIGLFIQMFCAGLRSQLDDAKYDCNPLIDPNEGNDWFRPWPETPQKPAVHMPCYRLKGSWQTCSDCTKKTTFSICLRLKNQQKAKLWVITQWTSKKRSAHIILKVQIGVFTERGAARKIWQSWVVLSCWANQPGKHGSHGIRLTDLGRKKHTHTHTIFVPVF